MPRDSENQRPITSNALLKRRRLPAEGKAKTASVSLLDVSLDGLARPRLTKRDGRMRVVAQLGSGGLRRERRYERVPVTALTGKMIDPAVAARDIAGFRPRGVPTTFKPGAAKPTHQLRPAKGKGLDPGGTIFGTDNRYRFDDRSFPWRTTGKKVRTVGKWGLGDDDRAEARAHGQPRR